MNSLLRGLSERMSTVTDIQTFPVELRKRFEAIEKKLQDVSRTVDNAASMITAYNRAGGGGGGGNAAAEERLNVSAQVMRELDMELRRLFVESVHCVSDWNKRIDDLRLNTILHDQLAAVPPYPTVESIPLRTVNGAVHDRTTEPGEGLRVSLFTT